MGSVLARIALSTAAFVGQTILGGWMWDRIKENADDGVIWKPGDSSNEGGSDKSDYPTDGDAKGGQTAFMPELQNKALREAKSLMTHDADVLRVIKKHARVLNSANGFTPEFDPAAREAQNEIQQVLAEKLKPSIIFHAKQLGLTPMSSHKSLSSIFG